MLSRRRYKSGGGFAFNNALDCGISTEYVSAPQVSASGDFTLCIWIKSQSNFDYIIGSTDASNYRVQKRAAEMRFLFGSNNIKFSFAVDEWGSGNWVLYTLSRISGILRCYQNTTESTLGGAAHASTVIFDILFNISVPLVALGIYDEVGFNDGYGATPTDVSNLVNSLDGADFASIITGGTNNWHFHFDETTGLVATNQGTLGDASLVNFVGDDSQWVAH